MKSIEIVKVGEEHSACIGDPECESTYQEYYLTGKADEVEDVLTGLFENQDYCNKVSHHRIANFEVSDSDYAEVMKMGQRLIEIAKEMRHRYEGPYDICVFDDNLVAGMKALEAVS